MAGVAEYYILGQSNPVHMLPWTSNDNGGSALEKAFRKCLHCFLSLIP